MIKHTPYPIYVWLNIFGMIRKMTFSLMACWPHLRHNMKLYTHEYGQKVIFV